MSNLNNDVKPAVFYTDNFKDMKTNLSGSYLRPLKAA